MLIIEILQRFFFLEKKCSILNIIYNFNRLKTYYKDQKQKEILLNCYSLLYINSTCFCNYLLSIRVTSTTQRWVIVLCICLGVLLWIASDRKSTWIGQILHIVAKPNWNLERFQGVDLVANKEYCFFLALLWLFLVFQKGSYQDFSNAEYR